MKKLLIVAILLFAAALSHAQVNKYYISASGSGTACSQSVPCTFQQAISSFTLNTQGAEIHALAGTYTPANASCIEGGVGICINRGGSSASVRLKFGCDGATLTGTFLTSAYLAQNQCKMAGNGSTGFGIIAQSSNIDVIGWDVGNNSAMGTALMGVYCGTVPSVSTCSNSVHFISNYIHDLGSSACFSQGGIEFAQTHGGRLLDPEAIGNVILRYGPDPASSSCNLMHGIYANSPDSVIENNLIVQAPTFGIQFYSSGCRGVVSNNVIIRAKGGMVYGNDGSGTACTNQGSNTINNNYFANILTKGNIDSAGTTCSTSTTNFLGSNISDGSAPSGDFPGTVSCDIKSPTTMTHVAGTAMFVNYQTNGTGDYHLKAGSPGIQAGTATCSSGSGAITPCIPPADLAGAVRPLSGAQDIGVFVFSSGGVPVVSFSPSPLAFGTVAVSASSTLTGILTNSGTANLTFSTATIAGTNASSFSITSTTCVSPMAAGATCNYVIKATPQSAGALTASLTLNDNAAGSPHQLPLTVTGGTGAVTFNPSSLAFGVVAPGTSSAILITTVANTGNISFQVGASSFTGTNAGDWAFGGTGTCAVGQTLAPGSSCTVSAKLTPSAVGARSANLSIPTSLSPTANLIPLTGTGGAPVVSLTPSSATCASRQVGTSGTCQAFTLSNTGNINLTGIVISIGGANAGSFSQSNTCSTTLAASASCTITVFFNPQTNAVLNGILSVASNASTSPNTSTLTGTGLVPATITLSPTTINFGSVRQGTASTSQGITLTNTGGVAATISSIVTASPFSLTHNCPGTISAGATCIITVTATPSTVGTVNGTVSVTDSATGSPHIASLSVTGVKSSVSLSPTSLSFGNQPVNNTSAPKTIILTNVGTTTLSNLGMIVPNVDEIQNLWPPSGWKPVCILPSCNPGGAGIPTATSQTFNNPTPSLDGKSMKVSITGPAFSNALWSYIAGANDNVTNMVADFWVQPSANSALLGSHEFDSFIFSSSEHVNYMGGTQCNQAANKWDVWDELNTAWVHVPGSACSIPPSVWTHIVETFHRVPGDTSCSGHACMHYDSIVVNGSAIPGLPLTEPTGPLPSNFVSAIGWHIQLDIGASGSSGAAVSEFADLVNLTFSTIQFSGTNPTDFTQTNTCVADLPPNGTCGISVPFTPGGTGARSATMSLSTNDPSSPTNVSLTGTGIVTAPAVCLSTPSINFGNQPVNTSSGTQPVTVTNCGTANLVISAVNATGNFSSTGCVTTVAPGATCTINGTFSPLAAGNLTGSFSIVSNSASSPDAITLSGFGTQTGATLTPSSLAFGSVTTGTSKLLTMVLANTGNTTLTVNAPNITGGAASSYNGGNGCPTLAPGATCIESVTFIPQSAGLLSATFNQPFGNGVTTVTAALSGTGVAAAPAVTLAPTTEDFGNVTTGVASATRTVQLTNSGNATLNISSITLTGTNAGDYSLTSHCGATLAAGAVCTVDVSVTPGGTGARTANLHFIDDAADTPQNVTMTVNGVAAPTPKVILSPTSLAFSPPSIQTTTTSASQSITVTNTGNANLVISGVSLTGSNPGDFIQSNACGTVTAGNSCAITVNCKPTAAGSRSATVSIASNAASTPDTAALTCTAFVGTPTLILAVSNINFGNQTVGTTSSPVAFTISNTGTATATGVVISAIGDFAVTDNCGGSVTAGSSCTAQVTFSPLILCGQFDPNNPGVCLSFVHTGQVSVVSNTSNSPQTVSLQGTAIPVPPPPGPIIMSQGGKMQIGGHARTGNQ